MHGVVLIPGETSKPTLLPASRQKRVALAVRVLRRVRISVTREDKQNFKYTLVPSKLGIASYVITRGDTRNFMHTDAPLSISPCAHCILIYRVCNE